MYRNCIEKSKTTFFGLQAHKTNDLLHQTIEDIWMFFLNNQSPHWNSLNTNAFKTLFLVVRLI